MKNIICTPFIPSVKQRADVFTKIVSVDMFESLCNKLDIFNVYAPAWGGMLEVINQCAW